MVQDIRKIQASYNYYEEIFQLTYIVQQLSLYVPGQKLLISGGIIDSLFSSLSNLVYVDHSLSRDQCLQASLNALANLLSKEETKDRIIAEILGLNEEENDENSKK
jgi:hypothetical protein